MIQISKQLTADPYNARLLLTVHDEIVMEIPEDSVADAVPSIKEIMENALPELLQLPCKVHMKVDVFVGHNWLECQ